MLVPLPEPKDDYDLLHNKKYWVFGTHPFTLFERCDYTVCGAPAVYYIMRLSKRIGPRLGSRCERCLKLIEKGNPDDEHRFVTRDEAVAFVTTFSVMEE